MIAKAPTGVVTGFVTRDNRLLVLRRSSAVGTYQGLWAGISGYIEDASPIEQMRIELSEELGIPSGLFSIEVQGEPIEVEDRPNERVWLVHPFRVALGPAASPRLDWEHVESRWIEPRRIRELDTVPGLWEAWCRVSDGFDR